MTAPPPDDLFERYESQYVRDLEGRLIRIEAATLDDLRKPLTVTVDGRRVENVPKAVPATDDQGNILRDEDGNVKPRLTTVYDAATWRYRSPAAGAGPSPPDAGNSEVFPIPILCHQHHLRPVGVCRVCSVLTTRGGQPGGRLVPACQHPLVDGMEFHTTASTAPVRLPGMPEAVPAGEFVRKTVKVLVELLAVNHLHLGQPENDRHYHNELLDLARRFGVAVAPRGDRLEVQSPFRRRAYDAGPGRLDDSSDVIRLDHNNCILCDRCVRSCSDVKPF